MENPAYGVSKNVEDREIPTDDNLYELVDLPPTGKINNCKGVTEEDLKNTNSHTMENQAYEVSKRVTDREIPSDDNLYQFMDIPPTGKINNRKGVTGAAQGDLKNTNSHKAGLVIGIIIIIPLSISVLAIVVAVVSVGLSIGLNSNSEIQSLTVAVDNLQLSFNQSVNLNSNSEMQSLTAAVNNLELSLNQSVNSTEDLDHQISALQIKTATKSQFNTLTQTVNSIQDTIREHSYLLNQLGLNQSVNTIEDLGNQISALQNKTATMSQFSALNQTVNSIQDTVREHSYLLNQLNSKGTITNPATSCSEIPSDRPSGDYWILRNYSPVQVYCDMTRTCCNTTGMWMRVANIDMTDSNQQCPDGFQIHIHSDTSAPLRTCGILGLQGCVSTTFPVHRIEYSRVCGRVIGYQFATVDAFSPYYFDPSLTLNDSYLDGVSLTHGQSPRKHIWTFVAAIDEVRSNGCPCIQSDMRYTEVVPPFIGEDYFCDTGSRNKFEYILYSDDPLWDGQGCEGTNTCCSFKNPPWFCKQLPQPTTDDIEMRVCLDEGLTDENIFIELVDIFVQ